MSQPVLQIIMRHIMSIMPYFYGEHVADITSLIMSSSYYALLLIIKY